MKEELGKTPAFASACANENTYHIEKGISKRFYAACAAMQGLISNPIYRYEIDGKLAKYSFLIADELLEQEDK